MTGPLEFKMSGWSYFIVSGIPTLCDKDLVLWESRAIMTYLVSAYAKDDTLYPKDIRVRALIDQRLHFDLGTLSQRVMDYFVSD